MKGICKFNKMINCQTQIGCEKCTWNPTYFERVKEENRKKFTKKIVVKS